MTLLLAPAAIRSIRALAALILYGALVTCLTWPLGAHLGTHLPSTGPLCEYDSLYSAWALSWESHALVTAPARLGDANAFHPARGALFYGPTAFGALPYFAPTFLSTGNPALALNLLFLSGVALTAFSLHSVATAWTGSQLAGLVAGSTFLGSRWVLWHFLPATPHFAVLLYLPWIAYLGATPSLSRGTSVGLLALIVLQSLVDPVYLAPASMAPLVVLAAARFLRRSTRASALRLATILAAGELALVPVAAGYLGVRRENPNLAEQTLWRVAQQPSELPWGFFAPLSPVAVQVVFLCLIAMGAASLSLSDRRRDRALRRAWVTSLLWVGVGLLISLTPVVTWYGRDVELPHAEIARWVPLFGFLRVPMRLSVAALIGLALLAGLAFAECATRLAEGAPRAFARLAPPALAAVLLGLGYSQYLRGFDVPFVREALPPAYPLQSLGPARSPVVAALQSPGGPILELPVDLDEVYSAHLHARAMYRSIFHWRPLLNGYSSYWPKGFPARMQLARQLPDANALAELFRKTGLETIVVDITLLPREDRAAWRAIARRRRNSPRLELLAAEGGVFVFRIPSVAQPDPP
jgi:hypothetical protein